jgi:hypothetical protein
MNIFYLDHDVTKCAEMHNDKHVVKMILEYAQLLSTAHRVLDGVELSGLSASGRKKKFWTLADSRDYTLYKATHIHHPSAVWVRQSKENYLWLANMLLALCEEYTYRYGKVHKTERDGLVNVLLKNIPNNIADSNFTQPTPAMPDEVKISGDSIKSYRNYYINNKTHLASWKKRSTPGWYNANI